MISRARFIYNPSAGKETIKNKVPYILQRLESMGYETSTFATLGEGDAQKEARRCSKAGFDLLVVAGGDGTVYEVINGISDLPKRPKIAILPAGTSNDFAKALGVSKKIEEAIDVIEWGNLANVDVGRMNDKYFINIAGGGSLTEITYEVPSKNKTILGKFAYHLKGIEKIPEYKPFQIEIELPDRTIHEEAMIFLIANSNVVGGFKKLAPDASISDGLLDVILLKKSNIAQLIGVFSKLRSGEHVFDHNVIHFQAPSFKIKTDREIKINLDGELGGAAPCDFEVLPKHLQVFCL